MWTIQPSLGERFVVNKRHYRRDGLSSLDLIAGTRGQRELTQSLGIPELSHLAGCLTCLLLAHNVAVVFPLAAVKLSTGRAAMR